MKQYLSVLFAVILHRFWPADTSEPLSEEYVRRFRVVEFFPAFRLTKIRRRLPPMRPPVQKTFTPPGWELNASEAMISNWKKTILMRPFNYCDTPKSHVNEPHIKQPVRLRKAA